MTQSFAKTFVGCLSSALKPTWKSTSWLLKLMIPITLTVNLMQFYGIIDWIAQFLNPVFVHLGLPGSASVTFISGAFAGTYAGLAAMMSIHMTLRQATIMALMICLCHALPMESAVNRKTGSSFWRMSLLRIAAAFVCAFYLNMVLPDMQGEFVYLGAASATTLTKVLTTWFWAQRKMAIMVFGIIYALMIIQRLLEAYDMIRLLSRFLSPLMRLFGLPDGAAYMWLVGNVLGISYGSAMMLELEEQGKITRKEANDVNYHLIMNHSMLEDTIVFALAGISAFWVLSTRMLFAWILVWARKLLQR